MLTERRLIMHDQKLKGVEHVGSTGCYDGRISLPPQRGQKYDTYGVFEGFSCAKKGLAATFDGGSRRHISEPDAQGRGVRGEGKPSPNQPKPNLLGI